MTPDDPLEQSLWRSIERERRDNVRRLNWLRLIAGGAWLAIAVLYDYRTSDLIAGYFVLALALYLSAKVSARVLRATLAAPVVVDLPAFIAVEWVSLGVTDNPDYL